MFEKFLNASLETLAMVFISGSLSIFLGLILAIFIASIFFNFNNRQKQNIIIIFFNKLINNSLELYSHIPFVTLMILLIPLTSKLVNQEKILSAVIPLIFAATPLFTITILRSLNKKSYNLSEIANFYGISNLKKILKIYIPECTESIIKSATNILIILVGYSTVAGLLGAGGIGNFIFENCYQVFNLKYLVLATCSLILLSKTLLLAGNIAIAYSKT